jgi:hypothetical protein
MLAFGVGPRVSLGAGIPLVVASWKSYGTEHIMRSNTKPSCPSTDLPGGMSQAYSIGRGCGAPNPRTEWQLSSLVYVQADTYNGLEPC